MESGVSQMSVTVKITTVGNSAGVILPKEVMARMAVQKGDMLFLTETADGIQLTPYDQEFAEEMAVARKIMRENRDVLRRLAE